MKLSNANQARLGKQVLPKKIIVLLAALLLIIQIASAQMQISSIDQTVQKITPITTQTHCKGETELWNEMEACKKKGMGYEAYIDQNRCKQVRCIEIKPTKPCPTQQELETSILACKRKNMNYEYYADNYGCRQIRCISQEITCPTKHELEQIRLKCKTAGQPHEYYIDERGCEQVRCTGQDCPTAEQLEERAMTCRKLGLEPKYYTDGRGCRMADCEEKPQKETVACKKILEGNCVIILCEDGYTFNSCTFCSTREPVQKEERLPEKETAPVKAVQPARPEPGKITPTLRSCITDLKDKKIKIDNEVVWNRCRNKYETAVFDFDAVRACIEDTKGAAAIDDEVVWNRCRTAYPQLAESIALTQACVADAKKGYAEIDDEVVWAKCKAQSKELPGAMTAMQKCVQDLKREDILIDDEVVWNRCSAIYAEGKLSPQPDPPGISPGMQPAPESKDSMLNSIGNFFKGLFR